MRYNSASTIARFSAATAATAQPAHVPDYVREPDRLRFRAGAALASGAVDEKAGTITGVSLMTADREATGHGMWIDAKTNQTFLSAMENRRVKAYATHGTWGGDGTLDEIGYWSATRIDGQNLRADFAALKAWRKHEEADFETLFELAATMPEEFGASLSFRYSLAWVRKDGTELATKRKWRSVGMWDYEPYFDPPAPADALRAIPSVRCEEVYSADFVDKPAANEGLFRTSAAQPAVDAPGNGNSPASTQPVAFAMLKEIYAKFSANPAQLSRAIQLHTENDKMTFSEICSKIEGEQQAAQLARLTGIEAQFTALTSALDKAGFKAAGDKSALEVLLAEHASFKANSEAHAKDIAALKAAGFEAKDGKTAAERIITSLAEFRKGGAGGSGHVPTGSPGGDGGSKAELKGVSKYEAALKAKLESQNKPAN